MGASCSRGRRAVAGRLRRCSAGGRWYSLPWPPLPAPAPRSRCFRIAGTEHLLPAPFSSGPRFLLGCSSSPGPLPSSHVTAVSAPVPRVPAAGCGSQRAQCPPCVTQLALAVEQDLPRGPAPLSLIGPGRHLSLLCGGLPLFRVVVFSSIWRGLRVHILSLWMLHPNPQALTPVLLASLLSLLCSCRLGVFLSCEFSCAPEVPCFILAQPVLV